MNAPEQPEIVSSSSSPAPESPAPPPAPQSMPPAQTPHPAPSGQLSPAGSLDAETAREVEQMMADLSSRRVDPIFARAEGDDPDSPLQRCRVVSISGDDVFVDTGGGKSQGVVPAAQFGKELPAVGDVVELVYERYDADSGLVIMSREGAIKEASWRTLNEGVTVEGRVTGMNKGGLEVDLGGIRGFMPSSHCDLVPMRDISVLLNQKVRCVVLEVDKRKKDVLLSRRRLLELEREQAREGVLAELAVGRTVEGTVSRLTEYGAFVDLGGVDGLLHIKDMAYGRVEKPQDVVQIGQKVQVMVLKLDTEKERISLGLKQTMPDPWSLAAIRYGAGMNVRGRVTNIAEFGAFVSLEQGVEGLIPISEMSRTRRVRHPREVVQIGQEVEVKVLKVDEEHRRISLSLKELEADPWAGAVEKFPEKNVVKGTVTRTADFGAFVELEPGVEGLIHISELSDKRVRAVTDVVKPGQEVEVRIIGTDPEKRRISLSMKPYVESHDHAPAAGPADDHKPRKRKKPLRGGLQHTSVVGEWGNLSL